jgi:hypothetical protein
MAYQSTIEVEFAKVPAVYIPDPDNPTGDASLSIYDEGGKNFALFLAFVDSVVGFYNFKRSEITSAKIMQDLTCCINCPTNRAELSEFAQFDEQNYLHIGQYLGIVAEDKTVIELFSNNIVEWENGFPLMVYDDGFNLIKPINERTYLKCVASDKWVANGYIMELCVDEEHDGYVKVRRIGDDEWKYGCFAFTRDRAVVLDLNNEILIPSLEKNITTRTAY